MRCKNCGAENDDSRYICEICGSPLYDEDDINDADNAENNNIYSSETASADEKEPDKKSDLDDKTKKSIIMIAVLAVILIAVIIAVIAVIASDHDEDETTTLTTVSVTSTSDSAAERTASSTTRNTTVASTTKESTTASTTKESTTVATTAAATYTVSIRCDGNGEAEGDGKYKEGETAVLIARADDGYVFDGWYSGGSLVSVDTKYSFEVTKNTSLTAVFSQKETETTKATTTESPSAQDGINTIEGEGD